MVSEYCVNAGRQVDSSVEFGKAAGLSRDREFWYQAAAMKRASKAKPVPSKKKTAAPVVAKKPKTAPKKSPVAKKAKPNPGGLAFGEFEALRKQLDLSLEDLSDRFGLSQNAIAERKASGRLTNDESGKVVFYARLLGHAVHLFGGLDEARRWLKTPQRGLHGAVPLDYARTDLGAREVENLLAMLEAEEAEEG
jgi:putative toxin-antitoxin system antitoxin component (TIGR02293 family)